MNNLLRKLRLLCLVLIAPLAIGALPASDSFIAGSDQALTTYSASWTYAAGAWQVSAADGAVGPNSANTEVGAFWNADSFSPDQVSTVVIGKRDAEAAVGPGVRMSTGGNYYGAYTSTSDSYLFKVVSGTWTQLATGAAWPNGATAELSVVGTSLTVKVNGSTTLTATDSALSTGQAGIVGYHNSWALANISSWTANNVGSSPATLSSPTPSGTLGTQNTATLGATTNQTSGTFYAVVDTAGNISGITASQVKAGQNNASAGAVDDCSASVSTSTPSCGVSGLTDSTAYSYAAVQNNANGDSNVVTGTFTTAASGGGGSAAVPVFMHHYQQMRQP